MNRANVMVKGCPFFLISEIAAAEQWLNLVREGQCLVIGRGFYRNFHNLRRDLQKKALEWPNVRVVRTNDRPPTLFALPEAMLFLQKMGVKEVELYGIDLETSAHRHQIPQLQWVKAMEMINCCPSSKLVQKIPGLRTETRPWTEPVSAATLGPSTVSETS